MGGESAFRGPGSVLEPELDDLQVGGFDLDAVGLDVGIVLEGPVDEAAVEGVHRFEFEDVAPAAHLLGPFLGALDELFACLPTVSADIEDDAGGGLVAAMDDAVEEVLEVAESGALTPDEAAGHLLAGVKARKDTIIFPFSAKFLWYLSMWAPSCIAPFHRKFMRVFQAP